MAEISEQRSNMNNEQKVAIITGANTGIGKETAKALFKLNYYIIMACRTEEKAIQAIEDIVKAVPEKPQANLEFMKLELDSLQSVREFAQNFLAKDIPLQLLVCNAGIMGIPYGKTRDGIEQQFGVNHLSHFLLTNLLLDKLKHSPSSRIVVVSSKMDGRILQQQLCNVLFANELTRRLRQEGVTNVTANSLHPGVVKTELSRNFPTVLRVLWVPLSHLLLTAEQGAKTSIYVATSPLVEGMSGEYFEKSKKTKASKYGLDEKLAADLWEFSEKLIRDATNAQTEKVTNS